MMVMHGKGKEKKEISPPFIVTVDEGRNNCPHMMIRADGYDSDTLDFTVVGNKIVPWFTNTDASGMTFGEALECLQRGNRVARDGWPKSAFLFMVPGSTFKVNRPPLMGIYKEGTEINYEPHIDMCNGDGEVNVHTFGQDDIFAGDWLIVPAK